MNVRNFERERMIDLLDYLQSNGTWHFGDTGKVVDQYIDSLCEICEGDGWHYRDRISSVKVKCGCPAGEKFKNK